jgi:hypothetical protein
LTKNLCAGQERGLPLLGRAQQGIYDPGQHYTQLMVACHEACHGEQLLVS